MFIEIRSGEKMMPPPTPTIAAKKPPRKAIIVTQNIIQGVQCMSPSVIQYPTDHFWKYSQIAYLELINIVPTQMHKNINWMPQYK